MASLRQNWEIFQFAIRTMNEQRDRQREAVRESIKASKAPLPSEIVNELSRLNPQDAHEVLRDHPGFWLYEKKRSYEASLNVFERSVEDLFCIIQDFAECSRDGKIFDNKNDQKLDEFNLGIQKELFAASNAAHALVDHSTRRLQKTFSIPEYEQMLINCFGEDGLHDFVIGLRNIIHHLVMMQPDWQVSRRFDENDHHTTFKLDKDKLLFVVKSNNKIMNMSGRRYLMNAREAIDLQRVFDEYRHRVNNFHSWFSQQIEAHALVELSDYESCIKKIKIISTQKFWKAMIGNWLNWKISPNPYDHLHRYLNDEQLKAIKSLPHRSREQVDMVIEYADTDNICDEGLRLLIYELFRRAPP